MKAKKLWGILMTLILLIGLSIVTTSCKDDEESDGIVGIWVCNRHYYGGPDTYTFKSNGQYTWSCPGQPGKEYDSGRYSFDPKRSTLTIVNNNGTTWLYVIASLTSTSFTMIDEEGSTYYYYRK